MLPVTGSFSILKEGADFNGESTIESASDKTDCRIFDQSLWPFNDWISACNNAIANHLHAFILQKIYEDSHTGRNGRWHNQLFNRTWRKTSPYRDSGPNIVLV